MVHNQTPLGTHGEPRLFPLNDTGSQIWLPLELTWSPGMVDKPAPSMPMSTTFNTLLVAAVVGQAQSSATPASQNEILGHFVSPGENGFAHTTSQPGCTPPTTTSAFPLFAPHPGTVKERPQVGARGASTSTSPDHIEYRTLLEPNSDSVALELFQSGERKRFRPGPFSQASLANPMEDTPVESPHPTK